MTAFARMNLEVCNIWRKSEKEVKLIRMKLILDMTRSISMAQSNNHFSGNVLMKGKYII